MRGRGKPRPNGFSARARSWRPPQCVMFAGARAGLEDARGGGDGGGRGAGLPGGRARSRGRRPRVSRRCRRCESWRRGPRRRRWRWWRRQLATGRVRRGRGPRRALRPQVSGRPGGRSRPRPGVGRVSPRGAAAPLSRPPRAGPCVSGRVGRRRTGGLTEAQARALSQPLLCGRVDGQHGGGQPRAARPAVEPRLGGSGRAASSGPAPSLCGGRRQPPPLFMSPGAGARTPARAAPAFKPKPCSAQLPLRDSWGPSSTLPDATSCARPGSLRRAGSWKDRKFVYPGRSHICALGK